MMNCRIMICYTCGDRGYTHALLVSNKCEEFAVHRYILLDSFLRNLKFIVYVRLDVQK